MPAPLRSATVVLATQVLLFAASPVLGEPLRCQRSIAKESSKFIQSKMKALGKCEDGKVLGRVAANSDCHADSMTALLIARAQAKLQRRLSAHCGGADGICGTGDDDSLASIGWGSITSCPNLENGACNMAVNNCADIGACLLCIDEAAVDQAMTLYYGALDSMQFGTASPLNSCQRAIGSAPTQFVESKSKALQKCWDARLKGLHSNSCPTPGDGIAAGRIQRAQVKAMGAICRRCGGSDLACDGAGDFTPAQIGFVGTCPSVTVPGGSSCGGPINSLQDLVACVDCVSEFKVDCADALTVPGFESYPTQCNVQVGTTSTTIPSTTTTTIPSCPPPAASLSLSLRGRRTAEDRGSTRAPSHRSRGRSTTVREPS